MIIRLVFLMFLIVPLSAQAQEFSPDLNFLIDYNRMPADQNPSYNSAVDILDWRIIGHKKKVLGAVEDIVINTGGEITALRVNFDRLRLGDSLYLNYKEVGIRPVTKGFSLPMDADQLKEFFPSLLAQTETAAGAGGDVFSVMKLVGGDLKTLEGQTVGTIKDVLFANNGTRAEALYILPKKTVFRGDKVAIPVSFVFFEMDEGSKVNAVITKDQAKAVTDYLKSEG